VPSSSTVSLDPQEQKMQRMITAALIAAVFTIAGQAALAKYPYGILPHDASLAAVKAKWARWQEYYVTPVGCPNPNTMLRACQGLVHEKAPNHEGHGYAMVFAAYLDDNDNTLTKLWNYTEHYLNEEGLMPWHIDAVGNVRGRGGVADLSFDIALALDHAARRWPGRGWEQRAETYILNMEWELRHDRRQRFKDRVLDWAVNGDGAGHYLNYFAFAHFARFDDRVGKKLWSSIVTDRCYQLMDYSYENYALPAWYTDKDGVMCKPGDPWGSAADRFDAGPSRTAWRVGAHYLTTGDPRAKKWADKFTDFFRSQVKKGTKHVTAEDDITAIRSGYRPSSGLAYGDPQQPRCTTIGGAGVCAMASGNQKLADGAWNFLVEYDDQGQNWMSNSCGLYCMLIMSGALDCSVPADSTAHQEYDPNAVPTRHRQ
jgi:endo-1,4-beta-D-glucanase Y